VVCNFAIVLAAAGGIILVFANNLWHFWLVAATMLIARTIGSSLASALAADLIEPERLARFYPWLNTMTWLAGIIGFASSGYVIETLGESLLYQAAALLSLAAAGLVVLIKVCSRPVSALPREVERQSIIPVHDHHPECPAL
jgi:MFS family permease